MSTGDQQQNDFRKAIGSDKESLAVFLSALMDFEDDFCNQMFGGDDFTIRLEVRGRDHKLVHARSHRERIRRPPNGVEDVGC